MKRQLATLAFALAACHPTAATEVETKELSRWSGERSTQWPTDATSQIEASEQLPPTEWRIISIDWDDADSGDINGVRFRLSDVDAPENGGVGAAIGAAECERERARGIAAREWIRERTRDASALRIANTHGYDRMEDPRLLIDLSVSGADVARDGIAAGHLAPWPHDGSRALAPKPNWCAED
jgi:endonuclease YncB( thermonuclease family)